MDREFARVHHGQLVSGLHVSEIIFEFIVFKRQVVMLILLNLQLFLNRSFFCLQCSNLTFQVSVLTLVLDEFLTHLFEFSLELLNLFFEDRAFTSRVNYLILKYFFELFQSFDALFKVTDIFLK